MIRGDVYLAVVPGDYGKFRPVVIIQNSEVNATHDSIAVCPITSHLFEAPLCRLDIHPQPDNGLRVHSQIMVDKVSSIKRDRLRSRIGRIDDELLTQLNRSLAFWLGL